MLMQRILTAAVLIPALLALVWYAPTQWLYVALSVVGLLMAWEWTALLGWTRQPLRRRLYLIATAALLAATWVGLTQYAVLFYGLLPVALIWLLLPLYLRGYPHAATPPAALLAPAGLLMIASTLVAIAALHAHPNGALKLLFVFFLVFAADTGAYFAGRRFGKRKLAPAISPGKSVEGALGGLVAVAIWAATAGVWRSGSRPRRRSRCWCCCRSSSALSRSSATSPNPCSSAMPASRTAARSCRATAASSIASTASSPPCR